MDDARDQDPTTQPWSEPYGDMAADVLTEAPGAAPTPSRASLLIALHARDAVLRNVAHDLRTPLNGILLAASALEGLPRAGTPPDPGPLVAAILREAARMNRLIDDLLDVDRQERGHLGLVLEASRPADLVRASLEAFESVCAGRGIGLKTRMDDDLPFVRADRMRVQRIFDNLLDNAIRYSERGSTIEIETGRWHAWVRFAVIDHGRGVPPDERARLFQPFWRGQRARGSGSGLGLSIARDIAAAHGGTIGFEETPQGGSTFCFTLPVVEASDG